MPVNCFLVVEVRSHEQDTTEGWMRERACRKGCLRKSCSVARIRNVLVWHAGVSRASVTGFPSPQTGSRTQAAWVGELCIGGGLLKRVLVPSDSVVTMAEPHACGSDGAQVGEAQM